MKAGLRMTAWVLVAAGCALALFVLLLNLPHSRHAFHRMEWQGAGGKQRLAKAILHDFFGIGEARTVTLSPEAGEGFHDRLAREARERITAEAPKPAVAPEPAAGPAPAGDVADDGDLPEVWKTIVGRKIPGISDASALSTWLKRGKESELADSDILPALQKRVHGETALELDLNADGKPDLARVTAKAATLSLRVFLSGSEGYTDYTLHSVHYEGVPVRSCLAYWTIGGGLFANAPTNCAASSQGEDLMICGMQAVWKNGALATSTSCH